MKPGQRIKTLRNVNGATHLEPATIVAVIDPGPYGRLEVRFADGVQKMVSAHSDVTLKEV